MATDLSAAVKGLRWLAIFVACTCGVTCTHAPNTNRSKAVFSEKLYPVKARPRVADGKKSPKGHGRYIVGKPYMMKGKRYYPKEDPGYNRKGTASWYSSAFRGRLTANGEVYDPDHLSAAHPTLPLPSYVRVTNLENGYSLIVRVNDRGPYYKGRIIDVSSKAADMLDLKHKGTASVQVRYVGRAGLGRHDMPYLMASYVKKDDRFPPVNPHPQTATGVMVAANQKMRDHLRGDREFQSPTQTNLAGNVPDVSYQIGANARASEYTPSMSRNAAIASNLEFGFAGVHRIGLITAGNAEVSDAMTPGVKSCMNEDRDDGVRDMCELQAPLPSGIDRKRLTGGIWRRRSSEAVTASQRPAAL